MKNQVEEKQEVRDQVEPKQQHQLQKATSSSAVSQHKDLINQIAQILLISWSFKQPEGKRKH